MKILSLLFLNLFFVLQVHAKDQATKPKAIPVPPTIKTETAVLAAGCFWGVEQFFRQVPGVTDAKVGYTGGKKANPNYEEVSEGKTGHAEAVQIQFDPTKITYEKILELFFKMHDPTTKDRQGNDKGTQYRSAIFYQDEAQKKVAEKFMAKVEKSKAWKAPLTTELVSAQPFYDAEEYHQKYLIKNPDGYDNHYVRKISFDSEK